MGRSANAGKQTGRLKSVMMELRKCCNHPFLIDEQEWPVTQDPKQFLHELVQASGKLALIDSMLARMKERGHRVLIYSQFTTLLDLLEEWLSARQWGYQRIDGSVGGAERQSRIDQFNRRPADNFVFLLSTKAGGLGINLASADTVIIYDSDWNPHNDLQAQARAHRLGQLKPVMIYRCPPRFLGLLAACLAQLACSCAMYCTHAPIDIASTHLALGFVHVPSLLSGTEFRTTGTSLDKMCKIYSVLESSSQTPGRPRFSFNDITLRNCQLCRINKPYRDAQDKLLWRDKTCPART